MRDTTPHAENAVLSGSFGLSAARAARPHPVQVAGSSRAVLLFMSCFIRNAVLFIMHRIFCFELVRQPSLGCSENWTLNTSVVTF
jgi:hypothetical protein